MVRMVYYEWPASQICLECVNKTSDVLEDSAALCGINCSSNNGTTCPMFEQSPDIEE